MIDRLRPFRHARPLTGWDLHDQPEPDKVTIVRRLELSFLAFLAVVAVALVLGGIIVELIARLMP